MRGRWLTLALASVGYWLGYRAGFAHGVNAAVRALGRGWLGAWHG